MPKPPRLHFLSLPKQASLAVSDQPPNQNPNPKNLSNSMASSRVMASSSSAASDITRQSSIYSLKSLGSMNIDDLFRNIESDGGGGNTSPATISRQGSIGTVKVDEDWREIDGGEMTLEDFLARAGAVTEEDVRVPSGGGFGSGQVGVVDPIRGGGRGRKRDTTMDPAEKAALQRQKRMIKNRESAARLRERKQAYTVELESLVTQLEEENAQLLRHQEERNRKRLKQLAESLIPVTECRRPLRPLRRTHSMEW